MKTLREHRNKNMLSIRDLAKKSGCSPTTVLRIELKRLMPANATMQRIAAALACPVEEIKEFKEALELRGKTYRATA